LAGSAVALERRPAVVLFNVSASIKEIIRAKLRGQQVVLRIDGMYFDRLSPAFIASFKWPMRTLLRVCSRWGAARESLSFVANLVDQNYGAFARIALADRVVYQSEFSRQLHARYFPHKPFDTIVNGAVFQGGDRPARIRTKDGVIRLVTTYDDWKPSKRVQDVLSFLKWACEARGAPLHLTVLGYTGKIPACASMDMMSMLEDSPHVRTLPRFGLYEGAVRDAMFESDIYITFTYRDPCPNAVVEAMAHGLPVVAVRSGGLPDIVGDAGILVPEEGPLDALFTSYRHECDFPRIDFEKVLAAITAMSAQLDEFERRVTERFANDLSIEVVSRRYADVLTGVAEDSTLDPTNV
jgi:glycosyltransferase involved in cell wall biosynthesis